MSSFLEFNTDFRFYGTQHITVITIIIILSVFLPTLARRHFTHHQNLWIARAIAVLITFWVILYDILLLYLGKFNYKTDLPLDICNLLGLLLPFLMWNPNRRIFPYLYFWILTGTTQAVFAPHLFNAFPNFIFIKYWMVHGGLIIYILFIAIVWDFKLTQKDLWQSFLMLQLYIVAIFLINKAIGANYVYVVDKPPTASVLDYFGPWPIYLLVGEAIFLFLSFMVYLPYRKVQNRDG